ncbi:MAG TPA: hypothetical protein VER04_25990 [Polyangiaceae bacterium]|nr:hypothetical protein [Polyangiaceae bacterium]
MRLVVSGRSEVRDFDWESYALLRDNVQHFVEGGAPSGRFRALHALAAAVDRESCVVDAVRLRLEVLQTVAALREVPLEHAAISARTRAIHQQLRTATVGSEPAIAAGAPASPQVVFRSEPLPRAALDFVEAILAVSANAVAGDKLEIHRQPDR